MKLQQLRYIWEVANHDLNVSATAEYLHTSQPLISKQIRMLEGELGIEIFARSGKHLSRTTEAGAIILEKAGEILREVDNIERIAGEYGNVTSGRLSVATTYTQVRYVLPKILSTMRERYPDVSLHIRQGTTEEIGELASSGAVDFAITPEAVTDFPELVMMPCYQWNRCAVVLPDHPLASKRKLTFDDLQQYDLVTYDPGFRERLPVSGGGKGEAGEFNIAMSAVDTDVIKTYVRLGFGVGVIAKMAYDPGLDDDLVAIDAGNLFTPSVTHIGYRRGTFLRNFMLDFIELFAPQLTPDVVEEVYALTTQKQREKYFEDKFLPHR